MKSLYSEDYAYINIKTQIVVSVSLITYYPQVLQFLGRVAKRLETCSRKSKVPGQNPVASYVQR